ncbi:MAG: type II secretion system protein [Geminicoccaceae bacterium]|nr:type II secretion system GspH family protein [Geminicoccaceae bacterium]MCS7266848.1 type II secretion system GspH family protein [Geminicoccaceae bacterium]MDW8124229.1 type II secretion system protein [Geminicoccaceae bacterium]MDW8340548.1 type II secretion system protein [Geminicoccaceae bacterium]
MVAIVVLGIALSVALQTAGSTLDRAERARRELAMARFAETLLERAGVDLLLGATRMEGQEGTFFWRLYREREDPSEVARRSGGPVLWRIVAEVEDRAHGRSFALSTLRFEASR